MTTGGSFLTNQSVSLSVLLATHALTASAFVWVLSEGKPYQYIARLLFRAAVSVIPAKLVEDKQAELRAGIEKSVVGHSLDGEEQWTSLPENGMERNELIALLDRYSVKDAENWTSGRVSGCIYHGGEELTDVMTEAFRRFALSNPLHPDVFPFVRKMEAECVAMTLALFHGECAPSGCGTMTSGGTESILMAVKTYRDLARSTRSIREPELVVPVTAHAAFDKACHYFGVKLVHVPVDPITFRADPRRMAAAITPNTIALICSAPSYPQGVIDPVGSLASLAKSKNLPLHVDCCLGSFCIAFSEEAGFPLTEPFDFRVDGVTSISVDTHKYGFAPKGSSVVLYARKDIRHAQYFVAPEWTGGIYASPSIAGSRPGALIAACWATMMTVGKSGYVKATQKILTAAKEITQGVRSTPDLKLFGQPDLSVVCFGPKDGSSLNIYNVADSLTERGWNLNTLQNPPCVHICVTYANCGSSAKFVDDLRKAIDHVKTAPAGTFKDGAGAMYGLAASIPDKSVVSQVAFGFLDALYATRK